MKHIVYFLFAVAALTVMSCKDEKSVSIYEYHAHIHSPDEADRHIGDTLAIEVEFESHTGEIVHHIHVRIFNADTQTEVYAQPANPHVHTAGSYTFEDEVILSGQAGFTPGDWVLEATVWGEDDGEEEETESVHFHIHN
jgi:hypothetical protein